MSSSKELPADKALVKLMNKARQERNQMHTYINECYEFALLDDRQMINEHTTIGQAREDDVFDVTFAEAVEDFASTQQDDFTPDYQPWVKISANAEGLSTTDEAALKEGLAAWEERLYELINGTSFYEACEAAYKDTGISIGAIAIPFAEASKPVKPFPVYMSNLLVLQDASGDIYGKWYELEMTKDQIKEKLPDSVGAISGMVPAFRRAKGDQLFNVIQGNHRDYGKEGAVWKSDLVVANKVIRSKVIDPDAPPLLHILRWDRGQTTAWPFGPAKKALPNARILDELGYNNLLHLSYASKVAISYENDGQQNFEGGIEPGGAYPRRVGSRPPDIMTPGSKVSDDFDKDQLRMAIRKAMFVDEPEQKGKTPPTTVQWMDERAQRLRRKAKRRPYREFVLPVIQRFSYVFGQRGDLPDIKVGDKIYTVEFLSPMAQTSDANAASAGIQLLQAIVSTLGEAGLASVDAYKTAVNLQEKLGDKTIVLTEPDEQGSLIQEMLGQGRNIVRDGPA